MKPLAQKRVAIVIPLSNRAELTSSELVSLRHLREHLDHYDKFLVIPEGLQISLDGFGIKRFSPDFFGSADNYKRMVLSRGFYDAFSDYEYMLTYHLDALVFSDELLKWCDRGYDLIGPPWVAHPDAPTNGTVYEGAVGNTGFCLKKVETFRKLFDSNKLAPQPFKRWRGQLAKRVRAGERNPLKLAQALLPRENGIHSELAEWKWSEERFLITRASHYLPGFRAAPLEEALEFGFEVVPSYCYRLNQNRLPFGCHAWERYDRAFWEPFLLSGDEGS
jgi:hypothetical protein